MSKSTDFDTEQACHTMDRMHVYLFHCLDIMRIECSVLRRINERYVPGDRRAELAKLKIDADQVLHALRGTRAR